MHYLRRDSDTSPRSTLTEAERAAWEEDRCNAQRQAMFVTLDVAPEWVRNDPNLAEAWAVNRYRTHATSKKAKKNASESRPKV